MCPAQKSGEDTHNFRVRWRLLTPAVCEMQTEVTATVRGTDLAVLMAKSEPEPCVFQSGSIVLTCHSIVLHAQRVP